MDLMEESTDDNNPRSSLELELPEFEQTFADKLPNKMLNRKKENEGAEFIGFLDPKRSNMVEIVLKKLAMDDDEIVDAIYSMNDVKLDPDRVARLIELLPTGKEKDELEKYEKKHKYLAVAESFMMDLYLIPRVEIRLTVFSFIQSYHDKVDKVLAQVSLVSEACDQIRLSKKLRQMLTLILALGNHMNQNNRKGAAYGFKLDALTKLRSTKSTDNKINLFHYLIQHIRATDPDMALFETDLTALEGASKVDSVSVIQEVKQMCEGMQMIRKALVLLDPQGGRKNAEALDTSREAESSARVKAYNKYKHRDMFGQYVRGFYVEGLTRYNMTFARLADTTDKAYKLARYFGQDVPAPDPVELSKDHKSTGEHLRLQIKEMDVMYKWDEVLRTLMDFQRDFQISSIEVGVIEDHKKKTKQQEAKKKKKSQENEEGKILLTRKLDVKTIEVSETVRASAMGLMSKRRSTRERLSFEGMEEKPATTETAGV